MKLKMLGLLFIFLGFAAPFILRLIFPNFLYASAISMVTFWSGFLLILRPLNNRSKFSPHLKWARYAIWLNIVLSILVAIYFYIILNFNIERWVGGYSTIYYLIFIANPIRSVFDSLVAQPSEQLPDGSVIVTYSFIRSLLTSFLNLMFYSSAGFLMGLFRNKKITKPLEQTA